MRAKGASRAALVSDAVGPAGLPPGEYDWLARRVVSDGETVRLPDGTRRRKSCPNTPAGFAALAAWLPRHGAAQVHACLEATGTYGDALILDVDPTINIANAKRIRTLVRAGRIVERAALLAGRRTQ